ncbi:hypothetical protein HMPREF9996_00573 [Aggregatibacter actinomycetemcomitans Y4]|uniref:hypothetical protein n=1 Tax=Aggregatibacter actinomycetemcomitans TaxID=714 RepID=UPI00022AD2FA|nr:hypothetical protein [Aggregatibacter actinomycetemcomitans]EKX98018.1 hypothetical protein HMPREF9996_00573 [Aggregatibacter actinomycetemcomitans Y4]KYK84236.1 hypothetical protein SA2200_10980 [Aggregatibacter actinomycetemcomitans serotype d str. SA2200]KYK92883.1 hypothetical protein SA269_05495 [Aggregatibacter actinomycetemcomitans serotype d str. SA269]BAS49277.1 hypothetical protein AANUM_2046 [Aggregatibacter actinomycetemcomitans NUM4039]
MGTIAKTAMPQLNKRRGDGCQIMYNYHELCYVYKAAQKYVLLNDINLKEYFNEYPPEV